MFKSASEINTQAQQIFDIESAKLLENYEKLIAESIETDSGKGRFELQVVFTNLEYRRGVIESQPNSLVVYDVQSHMQTYLIEALDKKLNELGYLVKSETIYAATHITSYLKINWKSV